MSENQQIQQKKVKVVKKKKKKEQKTFYKVMGIIADIIIYPVIIISLLAAFGMLINNRNTQIPSVFGVSFVKVMSGSMQEDGFEIGDIVFIKKTDTTKLKIGDVVAFYKQIDTVDKEHYGDLVPIEEYDGTNNGKTIEGRTSIKSLQKNPNPVYFHKIKAIYVLPEDGSIFFETAGAASDAPSDGYIRSDFIVGKYMNTPRFVRDSFKFCASKWGLLSLVVFPLSILVLLECLSIVEQLNEMIIENRVFNREDPFDSEESIKARIGENMELYRQVYFYATSKDEESQRVKDFLWGHLEEEELTQKEFELKTQVDKAQPIYEQDKTDYLNYWLENIKSSYQKRKLEKLINRHQTEKAIKTKLKE